MNHRKNVHQAKFSFVCVLFATGKHKYFCLLFSTSSTFNFSRSLNVFFVSWANFLLLCSDRWKIFISNILSIERFLSLAWNIAKVNYPWKLATASSSTFKIKSLVLLTLNVYFAREYNFNWTSMFLVKVSFLLQFRVPQNVSSWINSRP